MLPFVEKICPQNYKKKCSCCRSINNLMGQRANTLLTWHRQDSCKITPVETLWSGMGISHTQWRAVGIPKMEVGCKSTLSSVSFTTPRRGSANSVLLWWSGCTSDTSLDKDWGIRQSRHLPMNGKKLVIRQPIKKNNTRSGDKKVLSDNK